MRSLCESAVVGDRVAGFQCCITAIAAVMWRHEMQDVEHEISLPSCRVIISAGVAHDWIISVNSGVRCLGGAAPNGESPLLGAI